MASSSTHTITIITNYSQLSTPSTLTIHFHNKPTATLESFPPDNDGNNHYKKNKKKTKKVNI